MAEFRKSVKGIDFEFSLMEEEGEWYYKIKAENLQFVMRIDEVGMWKIFNPVPVWITDLEEELGQVIESNNL
jgi:hypothetical protein